MVSLENVSCPMQSLCWKTFDDNFPKQYSYLYCWILTHHHHFWCIAHHWYSDYFFSPKHIIFLNIPPHSVSQLFPFCLHVSNTTSIFLLLNTSLYLCFLFFQFFHSLLFSLTLLLTSSSHDHVSLALTSPRNPVCDL